MADVARANDHEVLRLLALTGLIGGVVVAVIVGLVTASIVFALVAGLVVGVGVAVGTSLAAAPVVRAAVGASPLGAPPPRLANLVDGLAAGAGVRVPGLASSSVAGAHALVVGERSGHDTLVVTGGLLEALDRVELEAVLARELALSRDHSARRHTVTAVTVGLPALSADIAAADHAVGGPARAAAVLGLPLRPLVGWSRRSVDRRNGADGAFEADRAGTAITRFPPALADALEKLAVAPAPPIGVLGVAWSDGPAGARAARCSDRIDALREL